MVAQAIDGDGKEIKPGEGSFPILLKLTQNRLRVIGTGFWISRWGMFLTARHVLEDYTASQEDLARIRIFHFREDGQVHLRSIRRLTWSGEVDLAVGEAENFLAKFPQNPLMNRRATLTTTVPPLGTRLVTYAYPDNYLLDFSDPEQPPSLIGDFYEGELLRTLDRFERPFIQNPHLETSVEVRPGASGGPVFDDSGRVVGVNCRGWDFGDEVGATEPLSSVVTIEEIMPLEVELLLLPPQSWEASQIPAGRRDKPLTFAELLTYGLVMFEK